VPKPLVYSLAYENANADCKKALEPIKRKGLCQNLFGYVNLWGHKNINKECLLLR
jgi:hypothetical protein